MSRDHVWEALFLAVWGLRVWLCLQPPTESSDLYRNLGYSQQVFTSGSEIYTTQASQFAPQLWATFWTRTGYMYPPFTLTFFATFAGLGLGLFWVKLALTLCDLASSVLVAREFGRHAGFLVFAAPITLWNTSHEGQFEALLASLMIGSVVLCRQGRWRLSGVLWALAIQTKQFGVLLAPFFVARFLEESSEAGSRERLRNQGRFLSGLAIGTLPFMPFYVKSMAMWFGVLQNQGALFNPYHWDLWTGSRAGWLPRGLMWWNGMFSYLVLFVAFAFVARRFAEPIQALRGTPLVAFIALVKTLNWGQFWYLIALPGFVVPLGRRGRWVVTLLLLYALLDGNSVRLLVGYGNFGVREWQGVIDRFAACRYTCDYSAS